jgi:hypothetical protein
MLTSLSPARGQTEAPPCVLRQGTDGRAGLLLTHG